jgi:mono/diheme cytochrome c family protein
MKPRGWVEILERLPWRSLAVVAAAFVVVGGCTRREPDMAGQPKYRPLQASAFFADGSSARPLVPGTVARGQLRTDAHLFEGTVNEQPATTFPFAMTMADLRRGQQRFDIYCLPCHGATGHGDGMIVQRGFVKPPSYHELRLRQAPVGHFYDVMTNGYGAMYSYAARVDVDDRWRIAAYIRALQLSQNAPVEALGPGEVAEVEARAIDGGAQTQQAAPEQGGHR